MVVRGRVKNGMIVLDGGVRLPEGQEVTVVAHAPSSNAPETHSVLDIPPVSLGPPLRVDDADDDLLGEMLEGRR